MDFFTDALQFAELSTKYRILVAKKEQQEALNVLRSIKLLINHNVERVAVSFKVKLQKKATILQKNKGIPLYAFSVNKLVSKGNNVTQKDITTLNPLGHKKIDGINILLDYSGSMYHDVVS